MSDFSVDVDGAITDHATDGDAHHTPGSNVPDWEEDGNSPFTATGVTQIQATLAQTYDLILVQMQITDQGGASLVNIDQINGSGPDSYYYEISGTAVSTSATIPVGWIDGVGRILKGSLTISSGSQFDNTVSDLPAGIVGGGTTDFGPVAVGAARASVGGDITSFRISRPVSFDATIRVYGVSL